MCLALVAWKQHPQSSLIIGFNRDEFFSRPTASCQDWGDYVGGKDLVSQGTWLAVRDSRFSAVTNLRNTFQPGPQSRGQLVRQFVSGSQSTDQYVNSIDHTQYNHFNLLLCDGQQLIATTNLKKSVYILSPGIYVINNDIFDPNITGHLQTDFFTALSTVDSIFKLLEKQHVRGNNAYGTRSSTVLFANRLFERTYDCFGNLQDQIELSC